MTTDDWGDCRIPEGVLYGIEVTKRAITRARAADRIASRNPDCTECHGTGAVKSFTEVYPCGKGCEP